MNSKPWLASYRENNIPETINVDAYPSVVHLLEQAMTQYADKAAFNAFGQVLSYADVDRMSSAIASYLQHQLGVKKGDRIALILPNILAFPICFLGIVRAGAVQVNVNPLYTARELEHQLNDAGCEIAIAFTGSTPTLAEIIDKTSVKTVITVNLGDGGNAVVASPAGDARLAKAIPLTQILLEGATLQRVPVALCGDDLLFLQYTGGTTGPSKGAALSHRNLVANTEQFKAMIQGGFRPGEEVIVTAIPLYHIFALMAKIAYFSVGATNWLVANPRDMDGFIDVLKVSGLSAFLGVNTLYSGLTLHPRIAEVNFTNLRMSIGGGAAVVAATSEKWKAITGNFIREGYGLSETSPLLSFNPVSVTSFTGTTGLPVPNTEIKLLDDTDVEVALGMSGEICAKGPQVMRGYWNQPEVNRAAFTHDGYFRTGDIGVYDEKGFLKIVDRKKDMIIVSGFNVFPNEIEAIASACAGVAECACIGVADDKTGEAVKLFVVKAPGAALEIETVRTHCRDEMAGYKVPKYVSFVAALPKSNVGKILRRELRNLN